MIVALLLGLAIGGVVGLLIGCALSAGSDADDASERARIRMEEYGRGWDARPLHDRPMNLAGWWSNQ